MSRRQHHLRSGFTLLEILATLLLMVFGLTAVIALVDKAIGLGGDAQVHALMLATARSAAIDAEPLTPADPSSPETWAITSGSFGLQSTRYEVEHMGTLNGFYLRRTEVSESTDRLDDDTRWAEVTVDVFFDANGAYLTSIRQRILRRTP